MKNKYTDIVNELTDREIMFHLIATQVLLIVISLILGFFLFDDFGSFWELLKWNDSKIWTVGAISGLVIVNLDILLMRILPSSYYDDGGLNQRLFQNKSVWQIAAIAALVAMGEEVLFRGVLQTHFGLILTSIIFALIHYRYLFNPFLFINIVVLSFFIGYIYEMIDNLLVTIVMHFIVDFLLGVIIRFSKKKSHQRGGRPTHE